MILFGIVISATTPWLLRIVKLHQAFQEVQMNAIATRVWLNPIREDDARTAHSWEITSKATTLVAFNGQRTTWSQTGTRLVAQWNTTTILRKTARRSSIDRLPLHAA